MGRELWPQEQAAYAEVTGIDRPLEIRVARGGFNTPQRTTAQAIFVHASNPIAQISLPQLSAILGANPALTRWGQLGLTGEWADRAIHIYMPPATSPNAMSMQISALKGASWSPAAKAGTIAETAAAIAADPGAIGFGGFEEGGAGIKPLAVARTDRGPAVTASYETASTGTYPLTRYMYIRLTRRPGQPIPGHVREFLRYVLSRQGQAPIPFSGYFPLTAREAAEELQKLE
jgi:ABC-type phosphate transport system substrate-binding protein